MVERREVLAPIVTFVFLLNVAAVKQRRLEMQAPVRDRGAAVKAVGAARGEAVPAPVLQRLERFQVVAWRGRKLDQRRLKLSILVDRARAVNVVARMDVSDGMMGSPLRLAVAQVSGLLGQLYRRRLGRSSLHDTAVVSIRGGAVVGPQLRLGRAKH